MSIEVSTLELPPLGTLTLAVKEGKLVFLGLGNVSFARIRKHLPKENAEAVAAPPRNVVQSLKRWLETGEVSLNDFAILQGTKLQRAVWNELLSIPRGHTCSYSHIAAKVGNPKAVRAIGSAIGANPISLLIPCHRVLRSDGSLGGYAWGLSIKEKLLKLEADTCDKALLAA